MVGNCAQMRTAARPDLAVAVLDLHPMSVVQLMPRKACPVRTVASSSRGGNEQRAAQEWCPKRPISG